MSKTVVKPCVCNHGYQDRHVGPGLRIFNTSGDGGSAYCTVCGRKIVLSGGKK